MNSCALSRRAKEGNHLAFIPPIDPEISFVYGGDRVPRIELTHADQAHIREIGVTISITLSKILQDFKMFPAFERNFKNALG